jgi:hypothetical protein
MKMKLGKLKLTVTMICVAAFMMNATYGQASGNKNPADWPKDQDAMVSGKKNHKILLENDSVRVLEVTILPGEKEAVHHHQWPSVLYVMEGEDFIDRDGEGNVLFDSRKIPSFHLNKLPMTSWTGPQGPHSIENLSKTQRIRLIRVEIKK